jgi:hypothetical protein
MIRILISFVLLVTVMLVTLSGQETREEKKEKTEKTETKKTESAPAYPAPGASARGKETATANVPGEVLVHYLDGCVIRMIVQSEKLEIATTYGNLAVPVKDVVAIEFGLHYPPGVAEKIAIAVQKLGSAEFRERDRASKMLVEWGPLAYPAALEARHSPDLETANRAKDIVKQIQAIHPKKELRSTTEDKVVTPKFTIVGHIQTPNIKATTDLFGSVELSLAKMQTLKALGSRLQPLEVVVSVDAAKYANAGQWLETGFESDGDTKVVITAKGLVDTWPQQPGQWVVGPAGQAGGQMGGGGGVVVVGRAGVAAAGRGQILPQVHGGALFGRIGTSGEPFLIGAQYEGTLDKEGKLYLHIAPSPWGCNSTGTFEVKITRAR